MSAAIAEEAVHDVAVITATLLIHSVPIVELSDSSSSHTFISWMFVDMIAMPVDDLGYEKVVSTPARAVLTTSEVCEGYGCRYPEAHPFY